MKLDTAVSNAAGKYTLTGFPKDCEVRPKITKPGYVMDPAFYIYEDRLRDKDFARIKLIRAGRLTGRLVDRTGKGIPRVRVWTRVQNEDYSDSYEATTDSRGCFLFRDIAPGKHSVTVDEEAPVTSQAVSGVLVRAGETAQAPQIETVPAAIIRGRVLDAQTGAPVTIGWMYAEGSNMPTHSAIPDGEGWFQVRVRPGPVHLKCYASLPDSASASEDLLVPSYGLAGLRLYVKRNDP